MARHVPEQCNGRESLSWLRASEVSSTGAAWWGREVSIMDRACAGNHSPWLSCHVKDTVSILCLPSLPALQPLALTLSNPSSEIVLKTWRKGHGTDVPFVPEHAWLVEQLWLSELATNTQKQAHFSFSFFKIPVLMRTDLLKRPTLASLQRCLLPKYFPLDFTS